MQWRRGSCSCEILTPVFRHLGHSGSLRRINRKQQGENPAPTCSEYYRDCGRLSISDTLTMWIIHLMRLTFVHNAWIHSLLHSCTSYHRLGKFHAVPPTRQSNATDCESHRQTANKNQVQMCRLAATSLVQQQRAFQRNSIPV